MKTIECIDLADARRVLDAIAAKVIERSKSSAVIAVTDPHGELIAFYRMDSAPISSIKIAMNKAWTAARYAEGGLVRIDEPYLMECFALLRGVVEAIASAAAGIASGAKPPRPHRRGGRRGKSTPP